MRRGRRTEERGGVSRIDPCVRHVTSCVQFKLPALFRKEHFLKFKEHLRASSPNSRFLKSKPKHFPVKSCFKFWFSLTSDF
jgi:hypothetical protein